jgi:predicted aminopeptidase
MGYKMVTSKTSGSEYDFLNTSYQQLKDKEWAAEQARQENNKAVMEKAHAEAAANNDDELPF